MARQELRKKIDARVDLMFQTGLIDEAKDLYDFRHLQSLNTVGYKEIFDYIDGKISTENAKELIKTHTAQFAKRQMTWWKRDTTIHWIDAMNLSEMNGIREFVETIHLGRTS